MSLNDYLSHKRRAVLARQQRIADGSAQATPLHAHVSAEGRSGIRRLRIREHQVISDSPYDFAGFNLGPSSPELQLGVLGTCVTHIFEIQAALLQVPLDSIEVDVHGTIDPRGGHPGHESRPSGRTTSTTKSKWPPAHRMRSSTSCSPRSRKTAPS